MKKFIGTILAAVLCGTPVVLAQTFTAQSGVSLLTGVSATATQTGTSRLPNFSGAGTLSVAESGITGSPSGCTIALKYQQNNAAVPTSAVSTTSFTPSTGVQQFSIAPSVASGDNYVAVYACSSTYPTAGLLSVSFSPITTTTNSGASQAVTVTSGALTATIAAPGDPCRNPNIAKSTVAIGVTTAATTQLVAPSGSTAVYLCTLQANVVGTSPTLLVEYGTSTNCTGTHALTGTIPVATGTYFSTGNDSAIATTASQGLCLVSGGTLTTTGIQGFATYVQQ